MVHYEAVVCRNCHAIAAVIDTVLRAKVDELADRVQSLIDGR